MSRVRMGGAMSLSIALLLVAFSFTSGGGLLMERIPLHDLVLAAVALLSLAAMPMLVKRQTWFISCAAIYQCAVGFLCVDFLFKLTTFRLMPYRVLGFPPHGWLSSLALGSVTLAVLVAPLVILALLFWWSRLRLPRQMLVLLVTTTTIAFAVVGHSPKSSWYRLRHDIQVDPDLISSIANDAYDSSRPRMENAISLLAWVSTNIYYKGSNPLLPLPELIANRKGTCGVRAKVFGALCRVKNYPVRYLQLNSDDYEMYHAAVEVYVDGKWVFADPYYGAIFYNDRGTPMSAWDLHNRPELASSHATGKALFENILIFQDGDYFHVGTENWQWFY